MKNVGQICVNDELQILLHEALKNDVTFLSEKFETIDYSLIIGLVNVQKQYDLKNL